LQLKENDLKRNLLPTPKPYWSLTKSAIYGNSNQLTLSEADIQKNLKIYIKNSVKKQMISDAPIGAFLSGGIDSSTIVALMQSQSNHPIRTFTIGFSENDFNEAQYAKKIAKHLGTNHTELYVSSKAAMDVIPKLPTIYDEPFSDSSQIPTFLLSQLAKPHVKVALSGDGADELFCGYDRYISTNNRSKKLNLIPLSLRKILAYGIKSISPNNWIGYKMHKGANALEAETLSNLYYILCSQWQDPTKTVINSKEPSTLLTNLKPELKGLNSQQEMMVLDFITYLPNDILVKLDRATMASSLETRVPFLDHKLIEYVWTIPHSLKLKKGDGKWILKQILNQYVPKNLTERPKMGFGVPLGSWLRGPLRDWAENLLNEKRLMQEGYFNPKLIRDKWSEHLSNKKNWEHALWNVLMFQAWIDANN
jgi:asparagine synthase (glutamine-hydrolysing)